MKEKRFKQLGDKVSKYMKSGILVWDYGFALGLDASLIVKEVNGLQHDSQGFEVPDFQAHIVDLEKKKIEPVTLEEFRRMVPLMLQSMVLPKRMEVLRSVLRQWEDASYRMQRF